MDFETLHGYDSTPNNDILDTITNNYIVSSSGNINIGDLCEINSNGQVSKTYYTTSHNKQVYVVAKSFGTIGKTIQCVLKGTIKGLNGLIPSSTYFCDDNGNLTTMQTRDGEQAIGVALSSTDLLINNYFWER